MYEKYKKLRDERELKDTDVSRGTGISVSTLYDWKKSRYEPKLDKIMALAKFFEVPITYFIE